MKKFMAALITTIVCIIFVGISNNEMNVKAEMNNYPQHDVNNDGEMDVFDLVLMKNQIMNQKTKATQLNSYDVNWFKLYISNGEEVTSVFANENPEYTKTLLQNSKKLKAEGNYIALQYNVRIVNLIFENCSEATAEMQQNCFDSFCMDKMNHYICLTQNEEFIYAKEFDVFNYTNEQYNINNMCDVMDIISSKEIEKIDEKEIVFKDGKKMIIPVTHQSNGLEGCGATFEIPEYMVNVYEVENGKIAINFNKNPINYANVEANIDDALNIMREMKGSIKINVVSNDTVECVKEEETIKIKFAKITYEDEEIGEFYFGSCSEDGTEYYMYADEVGCICLNITEKK